MAIKPTHLPNFMSCDLSKGEFKTLTSFAKSATSGGTESRFLGVIEGYASTSHVDREYEVISEKALANAADQLLKSSSVFFNHEHNGLPIGVVLDSKFIKDKGLFVRVGVSKNFPDIWQSIEEGSLKHFSVAGRVSKNEMAEEHRTIKGQDQKINVINEIELWEVSVVGIPANPHAEFDLGMAVAKYLSIDNPTETTKMVTTMPDQPKIEDKKETPTIDVTRQENDALRVKLNESGELIKSLQTKMDDQAKKNTEEFQKMKELLATKETPSTMKSVLPRQTEIRDEKVANGPTETQREFFEKAFRVPGPFDMDIYGTPVEKSFNYSPIRREYQKPHGGVNL